MASHAAAAHQAALRRSMSDSAAAASKFGGDVMVENGLFCRPPARWGRRPFWPGRARALVSSEMTVNARVAAANHRTSHLDGTRETDLLRAGEQAVAFARDALRVVQSLQRGHDDRAADQVVAGARMDQAVAQVALRAGPTSSKLAEITNAVAVCLEVGPAGTPPRNCRAGEPSAATASGLHPARMVHVRAEGVDRGGRGTGATVVGDQVAEIVLAQFVTAAHTRREQR